MQSEDTNITFISQPIENTNRSLLPIKITNRSLLQLMNAPLHCQWLHPKMLHLKLDLAMWNQSPEVQMMAGSIIIYTKTIRHDILSFHH